MWKGSKSTNTSNRLTHPQSRHHDPQSPPAHLTDTDFAFNLAQLDALAQDPHVVQFLQQQFLMFQAHGVGGFEGRQRMGEGFQGAAEPVVFGVVGGVLDGVATADGGGAVGGVGFVGGEVDFAEESVEGSGLVGIELLGKGVGCFYFCSWCLSLRTML